MKSPPLLVFFAASSLFAADSALPEFNSSIVGHPPLSLGEAAKQGAKSRSFTNALPTLDELAKDGLFGTDKRPAIPRTPVAPRLAPKSGLGTMPIVEPNPNIDYKIVLKAPDPNVDFKMLVRPEGAEQKPAK